jgi:uncharacterized protein DUF7010
MDALWPAFVSMLLFWPIAISAYWTYPQLVPLVLAIGMSIHWPLIGWTYGRTAIYTAHAVVRAVACFVLWNWWPQPSGHDSCNILQLLTKTAQHSLFILEMYSSVVDCPLVRLSSQQEGICR